MVDLCTNLYKIPRIELLRNTRRHLICCLGSVSMSVTLPVLIGLYREDTGEDLLATAKALSYPSIEAMLHSDEFSDIVFEDFTDKAIGVSTNKLNPEKVHCYSVKVSKRIEHIVRQMVDSSNDREQKNAKLANPVYDSRVLEGKERLFRSLAALGGEDEAISLVELQKQYFRDNGVLLDKAELRKYFFKSHVKQICDMYMYKEIEVKTDIQRTGSLYLKMKVALDDFLKECSEIRAERQGTSLVRESLPVTEEQSKQKKEEYKPVLVPLNNRTDSVYTQDEELARRIYASMSLSVKGLPEAGEDEDALLADLIGKRNELTKSASVVNDKGNKTANDDESLNLLPTSKFDLNNKMVRRAYYANKDTPLLEFSDTEESGKKESATSSASFPLKTSLEKEHLKAGTSMENGSSPTTEAAVNNQRAFINSYKFADDLMKLKDDGMLMGFSSTTNNSKNNFGRVESVENLSDMSRENDHLHNNQSEIIKNMTPMGNVKELQEIIANGKNGDWVRNWNLEGNGSFPHSSDHSSRSNFISNGNSSNGYQKATPNSNGSSISKNFVAKNVSSSKTLDNNDGALSPSTILSLYNKANGVDNVEDDNILSEFEKTTFEKKAVDKAKYTTRGEGIFTDEELESSSSDDEFEEGNRQLKIEQLRNEERERSFSSSKPMNGRDKFGDIGNEVFEVPFGNKCKEEKAEQNDRENGAANKHDDKDIFALENLNRSYYIAPAEKYIRMAVQQREEVEARKMAFRIAQQQSRQTSNNASSKVADRYQVATQQTWRKASAGADEEQHFVDNDFMELTVKKEVQLRQKVNNNHNANKPHNKYEGIDVYTLVANISSIVMIRQPFVAIKELQGLLELMYNKKFSPIDDEMELLQFIKKYCRFIGFISTSEILLIWMQKEGQPFHDALRNAGKLCLLY